MIYRFRDFIPTIMKKIEKNRNFLIKEKTESYQELLQLKEIRKRIYRDESLIIISRIEISDLILRILYYMIFNISDKTNEFNIDKLKDTADILYSNDSLFIANPDGKKEFIFDKKKCKRQEIFLDIFDDIEIPPKSKFIIGLEQEISTNLDNRVKKITYDTVFDIFKNL